MADAPRGYTRREVTPVRQKVLIGDRLVSKELSALVTEDVVVLGSPSAKVSVQTTGDLAATVTFSLNGVDYITGVAANNTTIASYSTHNVIYVKVVRVSGTGMLVIADS